MADFAAPVSNGGSTTTRGPMSSEMSHASSDPRQRGGAGDTVGEPSRQEIQGILSQFDAKINQMADYPAKDVINSLTKLAERVQYAPEIVSFLETKIHRAPPNYKLPIFYLTDSILKNVRGPYVALLARNMVPLYCNCVRQVSGKDLRRFVHVLNTWDQTRLFAADSLAQMRVGANRALAAAGEPVAPTEPPRRVPPPVQQQQPQQQPQQQQQQQQTQHHDMALRSLLTQMQNDMGIHPTEHLSLEQVRVQNPEWYNQLVDYHRTSSQQPPVAPTQSAPPPVNTAVPPHVGGGGLLSTPAAPPTDPRPAAQRQPRRTRFSDRPPPGAMVPPPPPSHLPPPPAAGAVGQPHAKSANVAHLMDLLNRKKSSPHPPAHQYQPPPPNEITNDHPRGSAPNASAVMSILQKLKGLSGNSQAGQASPASAASQAPPSSMTASASAASESSASKMWFSDKIVAHKDRVESNVQKLYAALPLVCRESGLRFKEQDKLNAHLDFLFQFNRAQKERGKGGVSRSWFPDEDQWVADFSGEVAPREATSSSFFDRKSAEVEDDSQEQYDNARVPVDEGVTRCRICGENFVKSWDEDEEDWMYTNAVYGTIHHAAAREQKTIFHKYCYETVMANSKQITPEHLIPGTPQSLQSSGNGSFSSSFSSADLSGVKRNLNEDDSDSDDEDDVKRVKTE